MTLKQIEYFVCVAETLNFTTAAKKCFISQAAITQQIRSLEEKLGVSLFLRTNRRVELTPAGYSYLTDAYAILEQAEQARNRAREAAMGISGVLSIGYIRGFEYEEISSRLRKFHETCPNIRMEFTRDNMSLLFDRLDNRQCDIILNLAPYKRSYPQFHHLHLKTYPMYAVLYPGHPLSKKRILTYADLKQESFIIMEPEDRSNDEAEEVLLCYERGGFIPNIIHRERELQTLLLMISAGLGTAILPEYCVQFFKTAKGLSVIPLQDETGQNEVMEFEAAWSSSNSNPAIPRFLEYLQNF